MSNGPTQKEELTLLSSLFIGTYARRRTRFTTLCKKISSYALCAPLPLCPSVR